MLEEIERREASRAEQQSIYDDAWRALHTNEPDAVTMELRRAFSGEAVFPLGLVNETALIVVACPEPEEIIADHEPALTGAGQPTVHKRSKTRINELYMAAIGSRTLAAVTRALAAGPGLATVACLAARPSRASGPIWEAIYFGAFDRTTVDQLRVSCWSANPDDILVALDRPADVEYDAVGRTLKPLPLDPELLAVLERLSGRTQDFDRLSIDADQAAATAFLTGPTEAPSDALTADTLEDDGAEEPRNRDFWAVAAEDSRKLDEVFDEIRRHTPSAPD